MPKFEPIGIIRTPFIHAEGTPIQPSFAEGTRGEVILKEEFAPGLDDLEGFDRIWLVYWCHLTFGWKAHVVPFRDTREHGVFSTRAPSRPNPIGISVVTLLGRADNTLHVGDVDIVDGTPLLDIKPYVPRFDAFTDGAAGWFDTTESQRTHADDRFTTAPKG